MNRDVWLVIANQEDEDPIYTIFNNPDAAWEYYHHCVEVYGYENTFMEAEMPVYSYFTTGENKLT